MAKILRTWMSGVLFSCSGWTVFISCRGSSLVPSNSTRPSWCVLGWGLGGSQLCLACGSERPIIPAYYHFSSVSIQVHSCWVMHVRACACVSMQVKLVQHTYSCLFGTFLCNSGKERVDRHIQERTCSVWSLLRPANRSLRNMLYSSHSETVCFF